MSGKSALIVGGNAASVIALLGLLPGWVQTNWGRWKSPDGEDARLVAKAEDIKGYSAGARIYFCAGWQASVDAGKIHDLAVARGFEIVDLSWPLPENLPPAAAKAQDDAVLQEETEVKGSVVNG